MSPPSTADRVKAGAADAYADAKVSNRTDMSAQTHCGRLPVHLGLDNGRG